MTGTLWPGNKLRAFLNGKGFRQAAFLASIHPQDRNKHYRDSKASSHSLSREGGES
jgi:hypothetical protein